MEELKQLKQALEERRPVEWLELPDIALYMDQVISYLPRQHVRLDGEENMTSAMVNNYIKDGLLPRAEGKRYSRTHLAYLTAIGAIKQVLPVKDMGTLIQAGEEGHSPEGLYASFLRELDAALTDTAGRVDETLGEEDLPRLALGLALRSYADKLACERVIELIRQGRPEPEKGKKNRKEKRHE